MSQVRESVASRKANYSRAAKITFETMKNIIFCQIAQNIINFFSGFFGIAKAKKKLMSCSCFG